MANIHTCAKCGGEFPLEDMASYYGELYCESCYEKVIENE